MPEPIPNIPPEEKFRQPGAVDHDKLKSWWTAHHILAYILIGLLVLAIAGVILYLQVSKSVPEYQAPVHQAKVGSTANFKTYTNTQYGFDLKYPQNWDLVVNNTLGICLTTPVIPRGNECNLVIGNTSHKDKGREVAVKKINNIDFTYYIYGDSEVFEAKNNGKIFTLIFYSRDSQAQILSSFRFVGLGTIEGSLSYPSSAIPPTEIACAQNLGTKEVFCAHQIKDSKYQYGIGYKLQVPPGKYNVYASFAAASPLKAYYSEFVTCGLKYGCPSHKPIEVTVSANQAVSKIDPQDWYDTNTNSSNQGSVNNPAGEPAACAQVITPAQNPDTGEVRDFPTPCDVPPRWLQLPLGTQLQ